MHVFYIPYCYCHELSFLCYLALNTAPPVPHVKYTGEMCFAPHPPKHPPTHPPASTSGKSKPLLFFEGQPDHRLPVHDQSLRLTGTFKALGRIIGHSILHGGPGLHELSPAVKHVLSSDEESEEPITLVPEDIPDIDLRQMVNNLVSTYIHPMQGRTQHGGGGMSLTH